MNKPCKIIKLDKYTGRIEQPSILLMNRSSHIIGEISRYDNWKVSLVANGLDEIVFNVHKYADGFRCPVWDDLVDLKVVYVDGFGSFEISVDYTDNAETIKSVHGFSLEAELAQINLHDFHVNDEESTDMKYTEYSKDSYDSEGNYIPTTFYNPDDPKHSLLHRVLADKAPHWKVGYVTPYIALGEDVQPEESSEFQRTYTVDGESIYDFLTGTVSEESNVIFTFDTSRDETTGRLERTVNCYSLCDCIDQATGETLCKGIGEDTFVFVSRNRLSNETTITSNKDNVKNCFRIEGGDDVITDMVRAVNMNGSNYIYQFADFQYNDMSEGLRKKIQDYQEMMSAQETKDAYYGENGIYTRLCKAYGDLGYYESSMMPNTDMVTDVGSAKDQYDKVVSELKKSPVAVSSMNTYKDNLFAGVTNNIEAYAKVFLDSRFDLEIIKDTTSFSYAEDKTTGKKTGTWRGKIRVSQHTDDENVYPANMDSAGLIEVKVNDDELEFARQKVLKKLSEGSLSGIDFDMEGIWGDKTLTDMEKPQKMRDYFNKYSLKRLESFYDGYNSCISVLMELGQTTASDVKNEIYDKYFGRMSIVDEIKAERQSQVDEINARIGSIQGEQAKFQNEHDFYTYLGDALYKEFCSYRREDTYTNSNYTSEGLTDSECMAKAKELIEAATKEAKKACVLQRTVTTSLNNLFALKEFEKFWDSFAMYNYIRVKTEDEILKLRLIGMEFMGESPEKIEVTFSEQIESVDGNISDLQSVIKQARAMATSYPSTTLQARQGADARNEVADIYDNGLNASKAMLTNNDNNEVTMNSSGILCKRMDDEGYYGDKQLRITGNIMAFTDDGWQSVKMAIGEFPIYNPLTKKYEMKYGLGAPALVGEMIAGNNLDISNKEGSVHIDGEGITISNGVIKSKDYKIDELGNETGSIIDLRDGSFSFADGGLAYDGDNELNVKGKIEATSILAHNSYRLCNNGEETMVLYGANYDGIWMLALRMNEFTHITLNENATVNINTGEMDDMISIQAHEIRLLGNIYSSSGQITTSDRNAKDNISPLSDRHMKFFSLLQPVSFTLTDGESGRTHIGFISQDVEDAMSKAGLTDLDFAGFCRTVKTKEIIDEDGNKRHEAETDENGEPEYVYALRYEEFIALNTFVIQRVYNENESLRTEVQTLQEESQEMKERIERLERAISNLKQEQ